nr:unnamed protein product [Spirometra erinaceieuropaei]
MANGYPRNFIERNRQPGPSRSSVTERPKIWRALLYIDGVSEAVSRLLRPLGIGIAHRPESTIRNLVMRPKTPLPRGETTNVIYRIQCSSCDMNYIGETGKRLHTRVAEHMRAVRRMDPLSLVAEYCANSGHTFAFQNAEILGRGNDRITRETIEAWHTGANSINRSVALPEAYQALRTQLSEQKSRVRLRQDRNPSTAESMGATRAAVLQPESDEGAIVTTAASSTYLAGVRTNDRSNANGPDEGAIITATHAAGENTSDGRIPDHWKPKDGIIRMGVKPASELFPSQLMDRVCEETKTRCWDPHLKRTSVRVKEALTNRQCTLTAKCATSEKAGNKATEAVCASPAGCGAAAGRNCDSCASHYTMYSASSEGVRTPSAAGSRSDSPDAAAATAETAVSILPSETQPVVTLKDACEASEVLDALKGVATVTAEEIPTPAQKPLPCSASDWLENLSVVSLQHIQMVLAALDDNSKFFCPVYDCFVFKAEDGDYVACVDISPYEETPTTLADLPLMKDFTIDRQVSSLGNDTLLYYTVKILDEGRLLQIVTNSGSHGTHVAAIAAAYYPQAGPTQTDSAVAVNCNGIAPGAQLVSIKIADTHLAAMETNVALLRAINWTVKLKCDIVNYSFGELSYLPNFGRINQHLTEFVLQHNVAFVASAGNNGPALGTVSSPGGTLEGIIGVAPLVFPEMMEYMYCQPTCPLRSTTTAAMTTTPTTDADDLQCNSRPCVSAYTWGSRGPAPDGALGPTVAAPGAAVADIAAWQCNASALLNGSSMSSPAVAGGLALVLSALRQKLPPRDSSCPLRVPFNLWRATIFHTSKQLELLTPLEQGAGLFQAEAAMDYLLALLQSPVPAEPAPVESPVLRIEQSHSSSESKPLGPEAVAQRFSGWRLHTSVTGPGCIVENNKQAGSRGIWLRRGWLPSVTNPSSPLLPEISFKLKIRPFFSSNVSAEFKRNLSFHLGIVVGYDGTASPTDRPPWLQVAPFVLITNRERILPLIIDPNRFAEQTSINCPLACETAFTDTTAAVVHPPCLPYHTCLSLVNLDSPLRETIGLVPITIHKPLSCFFDYENGVHRLNLRGDFHFASKVCRWFVRIPFGSTGGILRLRRSDADRTACLFTVNVMIPLPLGSVQGTGVETVWNQVPLLSTSAGGVGLMSKLDHPVAYDSTSGTYLFAFAVPWAADTLEVTLAQHWGAETPDCSVHGSVTFHGLQIEPTRFIFHASQQYLPVSLRSNFGLEEVHWLMKPTNWVLPLKPVSSSRSYISFGDKLDGIGTGLTGAHSLQLEYKFDCPFKCKTVVISFRRFTSLLYDADCLILLLADFGLVSGCLFVTPIAHTKLVCFGKPMDRSAPIPE